MNTFREVFSSVDMYGRMECSKQREYEFTRTVVTMYHRESSLTKRNSLSHNFGGYPSDIMISAGLFSPPHPSSPCPPSSS